MSNQCHNHDVSYDRNLTGIIFVSIAQRTRKNHTCAEVCSVLNTESTTAEILTNLLNNFQCTK